MMLLMRYEELVSDLWFSSALVFSYFIIFIIINIVIIIIIITVVVVVYYAEINSFYMLSSLGEYH